MCFPVNRNVITHKRKYKLDFVTTYISTLVFNRLV